jgi:hypothetical protein
VIDTILKNWPELLGLVVYIAFFLRIAVFGLAISLTVMLYPILIVLYTVMPSQARSRIDEQLERLSESNELIAGQASRLGRWIRLIQLEFTGKVGALSSSRLLVIPLEEWLWQRFCRFCDALLDGYISTRPSETAEEIDRAKPIGVIGFLSSAVLYVVGVALPAMPVIVLLQLVSRIIDSGVESPGH